MVYGIEVVKVRRRIGISSVWTRQTVVLNFRASVLLECTSSPYGECRSVSYGVMKIRKLVAIVRKCKMGGCDHHYLSMTWAAPIHSKIVSNKPPKREKWVVCSSRFAWYQARKEKLLHKWWIVCTRICELKSKKASHWWLKNDRLACRGQYFSSTKSDRFASPKWSHINCPYYGDMRAGHSGHPF